MKCKYCVIHLVLVVSGLLHRYAAVLHFNKDPLPGMLSSWDPVYCILCTSQLIPVEYINTWFYHKCGVVPAVSQILETYLMEISFSPVALKPPYKLFFRVKFYAVDPGMLHEEITRYSTFANSLSAPYRNYVDTLESFEMIQGGVRGGGEGIRGEQGEYSGTVGQWEYGGETGSTVGIQGQQGVQWEYGGNRVSMWGGGGGGEGKREVQ